MKKKAGMKILDEIIAEKLPNLAKDINLQLKKKKVKITQAKPKETYATTYHN